MHTDSAFSQGAKSMPDADVASSGVAAEELKQFIERIERLEEEKAGLQGDIKDVFLELKGRGFDVKAVRTILRIRKKDASERAEEEAILDLYMGALGMLADTPLGRAAAERDFASMRVSISGPGMAPIETTGGALRQAAARVDLDSKVRGKR